jgi:hypothetical protein
MTRRIYKGDRSQGPLDIITIYTLSLNQGPPDIITIYTLSLNQSPPDIITIYTLSLVIVLTFRQTKYKWLKFSDGQTWYLSNF